MAKTRDIVRKLKKSGFVQVDHNKHVKYRKGKVTVMVPEDHKEIGEGLAKKILREAGLR